MFPKPLSALQKENFVVNPVSNSAISLCASSTELTYPKLSACLPSSKGSRFKILAMLFLFVPQESRDLQLWMFGYITRGFPRIFGYALQVIKYSMPSSSPPWLLLSSQSCSQYIHLSTGASLTYASSSTCVGMSTFS